MEQTFDLTYDYTFRDELSSVPIAADPCRMRGVLLAWLTPTGWTTYLFRGNRDIDTAVKAPNKFEKAGSTNATYKIGQDELTCRAGGLTEADADVVATIYASPKVYALAPRKDQIRAVPVFIEPGTFAKWRDAARRSTIEVKINFPTRKSQLA